MQSRKHRFLMPVMRQDRTVRTLNGEKIDANQYYVYERHDNGVVYNYKTDKVWKQVDNPLKNGYPRGVTTMAFFRIAK